MHPSAVTIVEMRFPVCEPLQQQQSGLATICSSRGLGSVCRRRWWSFKGSESLFTLRLNFTWMTIFISCWLGWTQTNRIETEHATANMSRLQIKNETDSRTYSTSFYIIHTARVKILMY